MTTDITNLDALLKGLGLKTPLPEFSSADVLKKPLDIGRSYVADILCSLVECDPEAAYNSVQWPNNISNGDLVVILPKLIHGADPAALALRLMQSFPECPLFILPFQEGVQLLIMFKAQTLPRLFLPYINDRKEIYGQSLPSALRDPSSPNLGVKKVVVEFSSPNIASEFQNKHLRSTILGAFIANLYESMGWDVVKINYLGDWGKPIGLLGVGWDKFGSEELFQADPIGHLSEVYHKILELFLPELAASKKARDEGGDPAEIEAQGLFAERNAFFKKMEDAEENAIKLWKRVRDANIENYTQLYAQLNVSFDEYSGESQVNPETMTEVEELLKSKGLCEESGGAWIIDLKKHTGRAGAAIIRDRSGSTTYFLRDLAAILDRDRRYSFDKMIYVVANDHTTHFSRLFKVLELMDMTGLAGKLQHVSFNDTNQTSPQTAHGHKMLEEVMDQCKSAMKTSLDANSEKAAILGDGEEVVADIATTALLFHELSGRRASDHVFDFGRITSFDKGTGPDLRFWYKRLCAISSNSAYSDPSDEDLAGLEAEDESNLLRLLVQYPDITHSAYKSLEPATITTYLINIAEQLRCCFEKCQDNTTANPAQAMLYNATRIVLGNGMKLLGVKLTVT